MESWARALAAAAVPAATIRRGRSTSRLLTSLKDLVPSWDCSSSFSTGATGGGGGAGGTVDITSTGSITTEGHFAHGIVAQSIGGGGGSGGDSTQIELPLGVDPGEILDFAGFLDIGSDLRIGGSGGDGGDGGELPTW